MDISPVLWVAVVAACFSGLLPKAWEALVRRDKTQVLDHKSIEHLHRCLHRIEKLVEQVMADHSEHKAECTNALAEIRSSVAQMKTDIEWLKKSSH